MAKRKTKNQHEDDMTELESSAKLDRIITKLDDMNLEIKKITEIEKCLDYISSEMEELKETLKQMKAENRKIEKEVKTQKDESSKQKSLIIDLTKEIEMMQNREKVRDIEIKGIPFRQNEDLQTVIKDISAKIEYPVVTEQILHAYRIKINAKGDTVIKAKLNSEDTRNEFVRRGKKAKIDTIAIGFQEKAPIYINEDVSVFTRKIFNAALNYKKKNNFAFCWISKGKVFLRKKTDEEAWLIRGVSDLEI